MNENIAQREGSGKSRERDEERCESVRRERKRRGEKE